jgi:hypothetical protein
VQNQKQYLKINTNRIHAGAIQKVTSVHFRQLCPISSNRNETESFMEAAKAQNWAVEPQGKKCGRGDELAHVR